MIDNKVSISLGRFALYAGFFMPLASKLKWELKPMYKALAGTNAYSVFYRPELNDREQGEVTYICMHEIMHNMFAHMCRFGDRNHGIANWAMDAVGNNILDRWIIEVPQLGAKRPKDATTFQTLPILVPGFVFDKAMLEWSWEMVYDELMKHYDPQGGGGDDGSGSGLPNLDVVEPPPGGGGGDTDDSGHSDAPQATEAELDSIARDWTLALQSAAMQAKERGKLPGFVEEWIEDLIHPRIDWRSQLRYALTATAKDETSYRRFNRRFLSAELYLPGMYNERIGKLGYGLDTSGSMSSEEFKQAKGAMEEMIEDLRPEVILFAQCDSELHDVTELTSYDLPLPPLKVYGRGGTDLNPLFKWASEQPDLDAFVVQTDGWISAIDPAFIPQCPVIWLATTDHTEYMTFGKVIRVDLQQGR